MVTYFVLGIIAYFLFDYEKLFSGDILQNYMKPTNSRWVVLGPSLQVIRGLIFAIVLWPFRIIILKSNFGWLKLWGLLLGLAILSTSGPSPGSVEGMIYTKISVINQILYLPEIVIQTLFFSWVIYRWYEKPSTVLNIIFIIILALIVFFSIAGFLALS